MFAGHVVGRGQDCAGGWTAEHALRARRVGDGEREVRAAAGDQVEGVRAADAVDVAIEPGGDIVDIDPVEHGRRP